MGTPRPSAPPPEASAALSRWAHAADDEQARTVVVVVRPDADPRELADISHLSGMEILTVGVKTVVAKVSPSGLRSILQQPWALRLEEPRTLFPAAGKS